MSQLKKYNPSTQEWEATIAGAEGPQGIQGETGPGLAAGGTAGQILSKIDGTDYNTQWIDEAPAASYTSTIKHAVKLGESIAKGQAVYVSSANGTNMVVSKASNGGESTSSKTMGLLATGGSTNATVNVITEGLLAGLNTSSATAGDPVWLGTSGNLIYGLTNKPSAPSHLVFIGIVTRVHANQGEIFIRPQNGFELDELHDVSITSPAAGEIVARNSANTLWENQTLAEAGVSAVGHTHDDRYYTETETNNAISTAIANVVNSAPAVLDTLNELSTSLNNDPSFATTVANALAALVPAGTISQTARAAAPNGYLLCDGSAVSRTTYSALFDAIGTVYGSGNGTTTFNIPNLQGNIPVGKNTGTFSTLGATGGAETVTLAATQIPAHTHSGTTGDQSVNHTHGFSGTTSTAGNHSHSASVGVSGADDNNHTGNGDMVADSDAGYRTQRGVSVSAAGDHTHTFSGTTSGVSTGHTHNFTTDNGTGGGQAHNNLQPYIVLNYMIKI
jgi:microcystin-dependent protein